MASERYIIAVSDSEKTEESNTAGPNFSQTTQQIAPGVAVNVAPTSKLEEVLKTIELPKITNRELTTLCTNIQSELDNNHSVISETKFMIKNLIIEMKEIYQQNANNFDNEYSNKYDENKDICDKHGLPIIHNYGNGINLFANTQCDQASLESLLPNMLRGAKECPSIHEFLSPIFDKALFNELYTQECTKITLNTLSELHFAFKDEFAKELKSHRWMESSNPTAVFVNKIEELYQDHNNIYNYYDILKAPKANKLLRLMYKWIDAANNKLCEDKDILKVTQILNKIIGKDRLELLYYCYTIRKSHEPPAIPNNLICIDNDVPNQRRSFIEFVGNAKNINISTDTENIEKFISAFKKADFQHDIFNHPHILYFALAACKDGIINEEEYSALSQWIEPRKIFGKDKVILYELLDDNGNFTDEAEKYFLNYLNNDEYKKYFSISLVNIKFNLALFKEALRKLPKYNRIFFQIKFPLSGYSGDINYLFEYFYGLIVGENKYINSFISYLSLPVFQCFIDNAYLKSENKSEANVKVKAKPRLGSLDPKDIEKAREQNINPISVYYPRPKHAHFPSSNRMFHLTHARATTFVGLHDYLHALLMANFNEKGLRALQYAANCIRQYIYAGDENIFSWSLWRIADCNTYSQTLGPDATNDFISTLLNNIYINTDFMNELCSVFLNIHFNPSDWKQNIDIEKLFTLGIPYWDNIKMYTDYLNKSDDIKFNIFKCVLVHKKTRAGKSKEEIEQLLITCNDLWKTDKSIFLCSINFKKQKIIYGSINSKNQIIKERKIYSYVFWNDKVINENSIASICESIAEKTARKNPSSTLVKDTLSQSFYGKSADKKTETPFSTQTMRTQESTITF